MLRAYGRVLAMHNLSSFALSFLLLSVPNFGYVSLRKKSIMCNTPGNVVYPSTIIVAW